MSTAVRWLTNLVRLVRREVLGPPAEIDHLQHKVRWGLGVFLLKAIKGFFAGVNKRAIT